MSELEKRIAIIGAAGMLGHALVREFSVADAFDMAYSGKYNVNISAMPDLKEKLKDFKEGGIVINAAAFTNVDRAETEIGRIDSYRINVCGAINLSILSKTQGFKIIHYSTAFVFDGRKGNYKESDETGPLSQYGADKLEGEAHILDTNGLILRTDTLYGPNGSGNIVDSVIKKAREQQILPFVNDQICSPTFTYDLADITRALIEKGEASNGSKIYHAVNQGAVSKAELAREVIKILGLPNEIEEISTGEYNERFRVGKQTAQRPIDCSLSTDKLVKFGITPREWRAALREYLTHIKEDEKV